MEYLQVTFVIDARNQQSALSHNIVFVGPENFEGYLGCIDIEHGIERNYLVDGSYKALVNCLNFWDWFEVSKYQ